MNHIERKIEIKLSIKEINKETWIELRKEINNPFYEWADFLPEDLEVGLYRILLFQLVQAYSKK